MKAFIAPILVEGFAVCASGQTPPASFATGQAARLVIGQTNFTTGDTARFQRALLEEYGGIAIGRRESYVLARLHNAFGRLGLKTRALSPSNIAAVRAKYGGFPSDEDLRRVKAARIPPRDEGIGFDEFHSMLERYVGRLTGARYTQTAPADGFARGQAWRHIDAVERALKAGYDVPAGMVEPAHWIVLTDVRGAKGSREFLVSDPDGGRTAWVKEQALVDGSFGQAQFQLAEKNERPYIDSFFLPSAVTPRVAASEARR